MNRAIERLRELGSDDYEVHRVFAQLSVNMGTLISVGIVSSVFDVVVLDTNACGRQVGP